MWARISAISVQNSAAALRVGAEMNELCSKVRTVERSCRNKSKFAYRRVRVESQFRLVDGTTCSCELLVAYADRLKNRTAVVRPRAVSFASFRGTDFFDFDFLRASSEAPIRSRNGTTHLV